MKFKIFTFLVFFTTFFWAQAPTITSFSPVSVTSGSNVTVVGTNFPSDKTDCSVFIDGLHAEVISSSQTEVVFKTPYGKALGLIQIINKNNNLSVLSSQFLVIKNNLTNVTQNSLAKVSLSSSQLSVLSNAVNERTQRNFDITDLNNDGKLEIIASSRHNELISITNNHNNENEFNFSKATYTNSASSETGANKVTKSIDLTNDGNIDVLTSKSNSGHGAVFTNDGNLTPSFSNTLLAKSATWDYNGYNTGFGDLNKDGKIDFIGAYWLYKISIIAINTSDSNNFSHDLGTSSMTERSDSGNVTLVDNAGDRIVSDIILHDFNNDGFADYLVSSINKTFVILNTLGSGSYSSGTNDITFQESSRFDFGANDLRIGDLDNDGDTDVVIYRENQNLSILYNDGTGNFSSSTLNISSEGIQLADYNSDGLLDIISYSSGNYNYYKNNTSSSDSIEFDELNPVVLVTEQASYGHEFKIGDVNLDGKFEIISLNSTSLSIFSEYIPPSISITGNSTLTNFTTCLDNVSNSQSISISGANLSSDISITSNDSSYIEFSTDDTNYSSSITLTETSGTVDQTTIYLRLASNETAAVSATKTITISSTDAVPQTFTITREVDSPSLPTVSHVSYCEGETASALTATAATGHTLQWYTAATGGTAETSITPSTTSAGTTTYYVSQVNDTTGCESDRAEIDVVVSESPRLFQQALNFDGTNDKVDVSNNASLNVTNFTLEAWVKIDPAQNQRMGIVGKPYWINRSRATSTNGLGYGLDIDFGSVRVFGGQSDGSWSGAGYSISTANISGEWAHIAGTYDGSNFKLYINGVLVKTQSYSGGVYNNTQKLTIGSWPSENKFFKGEIDDVRVWNIVRTESEISQNKDNELVGNETGLVAYYNFNHGNPSSDNDGVTTLEDATTNNLDATLQSFALSGSTSNWVASGPTILGVSEVCLNSTETLTHTNSGGSWSSSDSSVISIDASGNITANSTGTATITYTYTYNTCSYESTKTITVNDSPSLPTVSDVSYCEGETASALTASAATGHTLQWYTAATGGTASTSAPTPTTTSAGTITYYVSQVNDTTGCESDRATITVTVNALPSLPTVSDISYCEGEIASALTATAASDHSLLWYTDATGGTASTTAPTPITTSAGTTTFYVSQKQDSGTYHINEGITPNSYNASLEVTSWIGQTFTVSETTILNQVNIVIDRVSGRTYQLKLYDSYGGNLLATSDNNVTGSTAKSLISFDFTNSNTVLNQGDTYYIELRELASNPIKFYYTVGSIGSTNRDGNIQSVLDLGFSLNGTLLSNPCESPRAAITVTVNELPVISGDTSVAAGESITLSATTDPATSNAWVSSNPTNATVDANGEVSGLVQGNTVITYTNADGCSVDYPITITVGTTQDPVLTLPATDTTGATTLQVDYTLPEAPLSGSVSLTFSPTDGSTATVWTMTDATSATFNYEVGSDPTTITNVVSGAALSFTTYNVTISYQDAFSNPIASTTNTNIQTLAPPAITLSQSDYNGVINVALTAISTINTGGIITAYAISPTLPSGLSFSTSTGVISGTPTVALSQTQFTITAINAAGSGAVNFNLFIDIDTDNDGEGDATDDDIDGDGINNDEDADVDGDGTNDNGEDTDGDGINDANDDDIDGDGINNDEDADVNGDGVNDNGEDTDDDGINDENDPDDDNDGTLDAVDAFPLDPEEDTDTDGDGTGDNADTDDDGDGQLDVNEIACGSDPLDSNSLATDTDGDTLPDCVDPDIDNDGIDNDSDADVDGDGVNDNGTDNDNDGLNDATDTDDDNDGVNDDQDNCPLGYNPFQEDRDGDGLGDVCDTVEINISEAVTPNGDGINDTWMIYNIENYPNNQVFIYNRYGEEVYRKKGYLNTWEGRQQGNTGKALPDNTAYFYKLDLDGNGTIDYKGWIYKTK